MAKKMTSQPIPDDVVKASAWVRFAARLLPLIKGIVRMFSGQS